METNQPPAKWTITNEVISGNLSILTIEGIDKVKWHIPKEAIEQLQSEAVEKFKREATNTSYLDVIKKEREEARADERKKFKELLKNSGRFSCLESWCMTRWYKVDKGNNYGELREEYCYNCKEINKIFAKLEQPVEHKVNCSCGRTDVHFHGVEEKIKTIEPWICFNCNKSNVENSVACKYCYKNRPKSFTYNLESKEDKR